MAKMKYADEWRRAVFEKLLRLIAVDGLTLEQAERWLREHQLVVGGHRHYVPKTFLPPRCDLKQEMTVCAARVGLMPWTDEMHRYESSFMPRIAQS